MVGNLWGHSASVSKRRTRTSRILGERGVLSKQANRFFEIFQVFKSLIDRSKPEVGNLVQFPERIKDGQADIVRVHL